MAAELMKLPEDRIWRNYTGEVGIDRLHGKARWAGSSMPEKWVGSIVGTSNPEMGPITHEGPATMEAMDRPRSLRDIMGSNRESYLDTVTHRGGGWRLSFLLEVLGSAVRLHIQAHPTTQFASEAVGTPYGKLRCYYIPNIREDISPYIRLGFQHTSEKDG